MRAGAEDSGKAVAEEEEALAPAIAIGSVRGSEAGGGEVSDEEEEAVEEGERGEAKGREPE